MTDPSKTPGTREYRQAELARRLGFELANPRWVRETYRRRVSFMLMMGAVGAVGILGTVLSFQNDLPIAVTGLLLAAAVGALGAAGAANRCPQCGHPPDRRMFRRTQIYPSHCGVCEARLR